MKLPPDDDFSPPTFRGIPLDELVSNPLLAVVKANERMAIQQVKFLLDTCFYERDGVYHPVMIVMSTSRGLLQPSGGNDPPTIERLSMDFAVPLITILPLNTLGVESTTVDFSVDVTSYFEREADEEKELLADHRGSERRKCELVGRIGSDSSLTQEQTEEEVAEDASISIAVVAGDMPLPKGVLALLDAYSKAIYPTTEERRDEGGW